MVRRQNLNGRPNLRLAADSHLDDIQHDAIEVHEGTIADTDVVSVVAEEGRPNVHARSDMAECFH